MATISETIQQLIDIAREQGIEPNRVRMSPRTYQALFTEVVTPLIKDMITPTVGPLEEIHGLTVEVWYTCPPDNIYVDVKPDDEDIGDLERRLREKFYA